MCYCKVKVMLVMKCVLLQGESDASDEVSGMVL